MKHISLSTFFVFDLDGTLFNSLGDLGNSVNYALRRFALPTHGEKEIRSFIGNGSLNLIRRSLGAEREHWAPEVHKVFMEHYYEHCLGQTHAYAGVLEFLARHQGPCALLTNKPIEPTWKILRHFHLENRFTGVLGGDNAPARKPDPAGLLALLEQAGVQPAQALMVGDDVPDVLVARNAGVRSLAILGGFGRPELIEHLHPDFKVDDFAAFVNLLVP
jgi:phosphoglycolate phosphatase